MISKNKPVYIDVKNERGEKVTMPANRKARREYKKNTGRYAPVLIKPYRKESE